MTIWVDADSCPRDIRPIILKAGKKWTVPLVFVANRMIPGVNPPAVMKIVPSNEGAADAYIVESSAAGDLVITRDIPLAAKLVKAGITVINDRGDTYTRENIRERLSIRDLMQNFRENGIAADGTGIFGMREKKAFADTFNRELVRNLRKEKTIS